MKKIIVATLAILFTQFVLADSTEEQTARIRFVSVENFALQCSKIYQPGSDAFITCIEDLYDQKYPDIEDIGLDKNVNGSW